MDKARHRGGSSNQRVLVSSVRVRLAPEDAERVAAKARAADISVSEYIRMATLGTAIGRAPRRRPTADEAAYARILAQLGKTGSNLNQLARAANSGDWPSEGAIVDGARDVQATCREIMRLLGQLQ